MFNKLRRLATRTSRQSEAVRDTIPIPPPKLPDLLPEVLEFDTEFAVAIEQIGFHPFILVRVNDEADASRRLLVCRTQNEAAEFVNDLAALPYFANSKLLRGIDRALQCEPYDAAELLFLWTKSEADDVGETIYIGKPSNMRLPGFYGYPAFGLSGQGRSGSRAARVTALIMTFDAYASTTGNDALRRALIEALAFALNRALGLAGRYTEALDIVDRAIAIVAYSIHLKAARHALALKVDGKPTPPRLEKYIGEDNDHLKQFVCPKPFEQFDIGPDGGVMVCCGHWLPTKIGNFLDSPVEGILNSPMAQKIRASVTDGTFKYCNHVDCPFLAQDSLPKRGNISHSKTREAVARNDFHVDGVEYMHFAFDQTCNLSCPSCRTKVITEKVSESGEKVQAIEQKLLPMLPAVRILNLNPAGEIFVSKPSRALLEHINDDRCPDLRLEIISNGTLFSREEWNKFPGIHNKVLSVRISTDAASKETFEKLRRLGKYDVFRKNMEFLRELRTSGVISRFYLAFTYQLDNFREMPAFIDFRDEMRADWVIFERLQNIVFSNEEFRHKAVHYRDHPRHEEFINIISDPIFQKAGVWHDFDYDGVDGMASDVLRQIAFEAAPVAGW